MSGVELPRSPLLSHCPMCGAKWPLVTTADHRLECPACGASLPRPKPEPENFLQQFYVQEAMLFTLRRIANAIDPRT